MGDVDEGDPDLALDRLQLGLHLLAQLQVEGAERLVEQQHLGPVDDRPRQRHPLSLAAGELVRLALGVAGQAHHLQRLFAALQALRLADPGHLHPVGDVVADGHVREEGVVLEDGVDRAVIGRHPADVLAGQLDRPARSGPRTRRSSAASSSSPTPRPQHREELPLGDLQIDPGDGSNLAVVLRQAGKSYVRSRSVYACDVIREGAESKDKLARKA